jgi:beta-galactosidase
MLRTMFLTRQVTRRDFFKTTALTVAAGAAYGIFPQAASPSEPIASRRRLSEGWEFCRTALGGIWDVWRTDEGNNLVWQVAAVPHCFNARDAVDPDTPHYEGPCWYRTRLALESPFGDGRTLLHFEGAGQKSEVFVDLESVGEHLGGYDEFLVDITAAAATALKDPRNKAKVPVAIRCDNSRDLEAIPSSLNDFCRYGGLYRPVNLVYLPAISLDHVHVETSVSASGSAAVRVKARLYNPDSLADKLRISIRLLDPSGSVIHTTSTQIPPWKGEQVLTTFQTHEPVLWSPSKPALYRCEISLASAHGTVDASERFGLRYFEFVDHGPFKLNGERLLLKGTQREEDHALLGAAMPDDLVRKELTLIKAMGANFLGLGHHQQAGVVLDLCDELGLLVLEEIPWSRGGLGGQRYKQQARDMLTNMIDQHYNHPSVILWGLGNENDWPGDFPQFDKDQIRAFVIQLNEQAHALDPTRRTLLRRCDFCRDLVDVYSPSIWAGWYHGPYTNYKTVAQKEMGQVNHFLHLEWGGDSHARRHSEDPDRMLSQIVSGQRTDVRGLDYLLAGGQASAPEYGDWSETYACNLFDWHLKEQETMPWLTGSAQWIFKDFASPQRRDNPVPFVNQKGLVERDLTPKEGYFVFQSYWAEDPMIHIYGHSWPIRWGEQHERKLLKVYSNCETVELFLNGTSCGLKQRNSSEFPAAGLRWLLTLEPGENRLRAVGQKGGIAVADDLTLHYQTERWQGPARLELTVAARSGKSVTIEARLFDAKNVPCLDARNRVRFSLAGDGTLIDDLGTSIGSRLVELYNGRAEIRLLTGGGQSVASVSCAGLQTAFLTVS